MIAWITENIDKILIGLGAAVVLFWPKIKEQIAALQAGGGEEASKPKQNNCCCCEADEPDCTMTKQIRVNGLSLL